ncbi:inorganic diphosphatase [Candidatus Undinarchaeota archaeon]
MMEEKDFKIGEKAPDIVNVVVTMPRGTRNMYKLIGNGEFELDYTSPLPSIVETGFIPETEADDGTHLKAFVLVDEPTFPGCVIEARPVGILNLAKKDRYVDSILLVPISDKKYEEVTELEDVADSVISNIDKWVVEMSKLAFAGEESELKVQGWAGSEKAKNSIKHSRDTFKRRQ